MITRREALQWTMATMGLLAGGWSRGAGKPAPKPLDILILGGTGFLGPHQVEPALARGHRITLFNRGRSAPGMYGDRVDQLIGNRDARIDLGLSALQGARRWDVVIDNSGFIPRHVRDSVGLLKERVTRYVYVSTVAVYDPSAAAVLDESSALRPLPDAQNEELTWARYGPLKAECDRIVQTALGEKATIVRPTYIVGPGDDSDRFTYWVERTAQGGDVLGPPDPQNELQWVDVRDLCPWIVTLAERNVPGIFNAAGPATAVNWQEMLAALATLGERSVRFHWATADLMKALRIELPLVTPRPAVAAFRERRQPVGGTLLPAARGNRDCDARVVACATRDASSASGGLADARKGAGGHRAAHHGAQSRLNRQVPNRQVPDFSYVSYWRSAIGELVVGKTPITHITKVRHL